MGKKIRLRSLFIGGLFTLFFLGLFFHLYTVQVIEAAELLGKAKEVWSKGRELAPTRGTIFDRNGNILAQDAAAYTVAVNPRLINSRGEAKEIADILAPILGMESPEDRQRLVGMVTSKNSKGEFLVQKEIRSEGWKVDAEIREKIIEAFGDEGTMNARGVYLIEEQKRYYPANELASHVLGYVDKDGNPKSGIEFRYHQYMKGEPGSIVSEKDGFGYDLPNGDVKYIPVVNGDHIKLTIDQNIQVYMEQAMRKAYEQYAPKSMTAVAVDPKTLEILAMANLPTYNPNRYWESVEGMNNTAVLSIFEPGSTFKIVTLAAAVEEGVFDPDATYMSGSISVPGRTIHDHNWSGWGEITYLEGLKRSSNVAFVKLGYEVLGPEKLTSYIRKFGFGEPTGVDLPGEAAGLIRMQYPADYAAATFGQGVAVTAIQQIAAVSAIANGGKLMKPYLLKEVIDSESGNVIESFGPTEVRQVISEQTAKETALYLEQVVSDLEIGTGRRAYIEGYRVAGKTGTAQVVVDGKYAEDRWVASFIGFAPVEDPKIALIVIAAEPQIDDYRDAGNVVAPVFKEIMSKSLHYLGVAAGAPEGGIVTISSGQEQVPSLIGKTRVGAKNEAERHSVQLEVLGSGDKVRAQFPEAGTVVGPGQKVYALTDAPERIGFPDVTGRSKRDVLQICSLLGFACTLQGQGYVVGYSLDEGADRRAVYIELAPLSERPGEESASSGSDEEASESPGEADTSDSNEGGHGEAAGA
jgi:penicillin-binding protein 2B